MLRRTLIALCMAACLFAGTSAHAVPELLQYQGRITDAAGTPRNAPVNVTFAIYSGDQGGTALWSQTFTNLPLDNGRFSVLLGGDDAPFTPQLLTVIEEGGDLFLGIRVGQDPEMTPRQVIASIVYSLRSDRAAEAEHAATADTAEFAREVLSGEGGGGEGGGAPTDSVEFAFEAEHAAEADHAAAADNASEAEHAATADTADVAREIVGGIGDIQGLPGLAFRTIATGPSVLPKTTRSAISIAITTPTSGYVVVGFGGTMALKPQGGSVRCYVNAGQEQNATPESTIGYLYAEVPAEAGAVTRYVPFYGQRVFEAEEGTFTYYLNVYNSGSLNPLWIEHPSITATFIPRLYGPADIPPPPAAGPTGSR